MNCHVEDYERYRKQYHAACQVMGEAAATLEPLEHRRLVLLSTESCSYETLQCDEYCHVYDEIEAIFDQIAN